MAEGVLVPAGPPRPLEHISPSRFAYLGRCLLREVWSAAGEPARLPGSPRRHLGTLIHALYRRAENAEFSPGDRAAVVRAWDEEVARVEAALKQSWLERSFVPLARLLRDLEEYRQAAIGRALRLAERVAPAASTAKTGGYERRLSGPGGMVRGEVDSVRASPEGVVIADHKTGELYEDTEDGRTLKAAYVAQLKLYAVLFAYRHGEWPARLELSDLWGNAVGVPFRPEECQSLLDATRAALDEVNAKVREVMQGTAGPATLGTPDPEHCRYCPYRPICPAYRDRAAGWAGPDRPLDVWGRFIRATLGGQGLTAVEVEAAGSVVTVRRLDPAPVRNPALSLLRPGSRTGIYNLRPDVDGRSFLATDYTTIYQEPED
jgi:hypothetical protein